MSVRHSSLKRGRRRPVRAMVAVVAAAALTAAGCGGSGDAGGKPDGPVKIKVWAWYPSFKPVVDHFNKTHTDVQIEWTNAGTGQDQYTKL